MKKLIFVMVALFCGLHVCGQDTIDCPPDNYFHSWPDLKNDPEVADCWRRFVTMGKVGVNPGEIARGCYSSTPVLVHGIAAAVKMRGSLIDYPEGLSSFRPLLDSSLSASYEKLRLYQRSGNTMQRVAEGTLRATDTCVSYFYVYATEPYHPFVNENIPGPTRVFEVYFDQPVSVVDTFYASMTRLMANDTMINGQWWRPSWGMSPINVYKCAHESLCAPEFFTDLEAQYHPIAGWTFGITHAFLFILPIFTPDTSATASVEEVQGAGRYVNLSPNPAKGHVTVTSSFGMSNIEAYDAMGRLLLDLPVSGIAEELDIRSWPEGVCVVVVDTPMGRVSKKLLVEK